MGFFKNFIDKINKGFVYIVDKETLVNYMRKEESFSFENNLEASFDYNLYKEGNKHHVSMWNYKASDDTDEQAKGVVYYFDEKEYTSLDNMINAELKNLPEHFKIELTTIDSDYLTEYKKEHPELKEEDY